MSPLHPPFHLTLLAVVLFGCMALAAGCSSDDDEEQPIELGALLPLTGALSSYGETAQAALQQAVEASGGEDKVSLVAEDTTTDPDTALTKLKGLDERGIKVVIGPFSSSEVAAVKDYADSNGMILISPLSTARTLAVAGDNVLRFTPDDEQEGRAVAELAWQEGIRVIVPVSRDDEGNLGLQDAMKTDFEALGGTVAPLITYSASETDFEATVRTISANISQYAAGQPAGVYLTAFSEVTSLFAAAANSDVPAINSTPWFGSDSVALSKDLLELDIAAAFAAEVQYPNPILGLSESDRSLWEPVSQKIEEAIGRTPDAFALAAYDALVVSREAMQSAGDDADVARLRQEIIDVAAAHQGLTGSTALNAAGDRSLGNYDFWAICASGPGFEWRRVATFDAAAAPGSQVKVSGC